MVKHYLLTWYGTTDLRAALGFEDTDGPVLSALKTGEYSDVVILGYTNLKKIQEAFSGDLRREWEEWRDSPSMRSAPLSKEMNERIVEAVGNTSGAHAIFRAWLQERLAAIGIEVTIRLEEHPLEHLNDATGIHAAASHAVRLALRDIAEKRITLYVSPGTPVMAYTWALIARANPHLDIKVISSSNPKLPPESVEVPRSLLTPSFADAPGVVPAATNYDIVIHLLGAQSLPVYFGIRQFDSAQHIIITSSEFNKDAQRLARVVGISVPPISVADPFRPRDTRVAISEQVADLAPGTKVAVNLTGGTKLMFAGALSACWELGLDPLYFEVNNHNVLLLRNGASIPFVGISDVEDFVTAVGYDVVADGRWPDQAESYKNQRLPAARQVWEHRDAIRALYRDQEFMKFHDGWNKHQPKNSRDNLTFDFEWRGGKTSLSSSGRTQLVLDGQEIDVPRKGFFAFISGHWLEDFVYSLLRPLVEDGTIRDLRVGMELGYRRYPHLPLDTFAELDCAFTDGKRLWIVECKAGMVKQEAIQKLENNLRLYGGIAARGLLVPAAAPTGVHKSRLEASTTITTIDPRRLSTETLRTAILGS